MGTDYRKHIKSSCRFCIREKNIFPILVVHHVDSNRKNNNPSNLWTLCGEHHSQLHGDVFHLKAYYYHYFETKWETPDLFETKYKKIIEEEYSNWIRKICRRCGGLLIATAYRLLRELGVKAGMMSFSEPTPHPIKIVVKKSRFLLVKPKPQKLVS